MQNQTTVSRLDGGLALILPADLAQEAHIAEGDSFVAAVQPDGSIVFRSFPKTFNLAELVAEITPENSHAETDWGKAEGKELP